MAKPPASEKIVFEPADDALSNVRFAIERIGDAKRKSTLTKQLDAANASNDPKQREAVLIEAHRQIESEQKSRYFRNIVLLVVVVFLAGIAWFATQFEARQLGGVEFGRPVIMFGMILATLGLGGFLAANAMLGKREGDDLAERFQMSREIFLVFSGIFATVVGFYFGSSDSKSAVVASAVTVSTSIGSDGTITALIAGGAAPYGASIVDRDGKKKVALAADKADPARFVLTKANGICPEGAQLEITGANGAAYPPTVFPYSRARSLMRVDLPMSARLRQPAVLRLALPHQSRLHLRPKPTRASASTASGRVAPCCAGFRSAIAAKSRGRFRRPARSVRRA